MSNRTASCGEGDAGSRAAPGLWFGAPAPKRSLGGERYTKRGAAEIPGRDVDRAVVGLGDSAGDGEPQAGAAGRPAAGALPVAVEDGRLLLGSDARAGVGDLEGDLIAIAPDAHAH